MRTCGSAFGSRGGGGGLALGPVRGGAGGAEGADVFACADSDNWEEAGDEALDLCFSLPEVPSKAGVAQSASSGEVSKRLKTEPKPKPDQNWLCW